MRSVSGSDRGIGLRIRLRYRVISTSIRSGEVHVASPFVLERRVVGENDMSTKEKIHIESVSTVITAQNSESGSRWKRRGIMLFQLAFSAAIMIWLCVQASRSGAFSELVQHDKNWAYMLLGTLFVGLGVVGTFFRWFRLLRSQGLEVSWSTTFRFSAVGYLMNLAPLGIVGGDLLKSVLIVRHQPNRQADAIASVLMDRVIGLAALFYLITLVAIASGAASFPMPLAEFREIWTQYRVGALASLPGEMIFQLLIWFAFALTLLGSIAMVLVLYPKQTGGRYLLVGLAKIPKVGPKFAALFQGFEKFGKTPYTLCESILLAISFHGCFGLGAWCFAQGLFAQTYSVIYQVLLTSLANSSQVIPLPLGPFELVIDLLYQWVPIYANGPTMKAGEGLIVAIAWRCSFIVVAALLIPCYFLSRSEVRDVQKEIETKETNDTKNRDST